jgi:SGNH domain (fused to AT3 domains)
VQDCVSYNRYSFKNHTPIFSESVVRYIEENKIPNALLVARWHGHFPKTTEGGDMVSSHNMPLPGALIGTIQRLHKSGCKVYLLKGVPDHMASVPKAFFLQEALDRDVKPYIACQQTFARQWLGMKPFENDFSDAGATIIDISNGLFDSAQARFKIDDSDGILWSDRVHLSPHGARRVRHSFANTLLSVGPET